MLSVDRIDEKLKSLKIYPDIVDIATSLQSKGRVCWLAGGIVRDLLLGREFNDVDLVTNATDAELLSLFPQAILVGQSFGVFKIPLGHGEIIDLTYFREEDGYFDGRRPSVIKPSTPEQDASRRDFTINALFWDLEFNKVVDYCGGLNDLKEKTVRAVGNPDIRFAEDALRVIRLVRFAVQLDFSIDSETLTSAFKSVVYLKKLSGERILQEVSKIKKMDQRQSFWSNDLVKACFDEIGLSYDYKKNQQNEAGTVVHDLFFMLGADKKSIDQLDRILKITKLLKRELEKIVYVLNFQGDEIDLCIEIEDNDDLKVVLQNFFKSEYDKCLDSLKKAPDRLVRPSDILGVVRPENMKKTLKAVRREQFLGRVLDVQSALIYVKNLNQ